jgi:hypothetical protein
VVELAAIGLVCVALGLWLGNVLARRTGIPTIGEMPGRRRVVVVLTVLCVSGVALFAAWLITHGQPTIGIAILVAVFVLPNLVLLPLRLRRARRRAEEARAARRARSRPHR